MNKSDAYKKVEEEFYEFNIQAVMDLKRAGIFTREKNTLEIVMYYIVFAVVWFILYIPGLYDVTLFIFYALNDFGSAIEGATIEEIADDYLSAWTVWVIG